MAISIIDGRRTGLRDGYTNSPERATWLATLGTKGGVQVSPTAAPPAEPAAQAAPVSLTNFTKPVPPKPTLRDTLTDRHADGVKATRASFEADKASGGGLFPAIAKGFGSQAQTNATDPALLGQPDATNQGAAWSKVKDAVLYSSDKEVAKEQAASQDTYGRSNMSDSAIQSDNQALQTPLAQPVSVQQQTGLAGPPTPEQDLSARNKAADVYREAWQGNPSAANGLRGANSDALTLYNAEQSTRGTGISAKRGANGTMEFSGNGADALPQSYTKLGSLSADQLNAQADRMRSLREGNTEMRDDLNFNAGGAGMRKIGQEEILGNMLTSKSRTDRTNATKLIGDREATRSKAATDAEGNRLEAQKLRQLDEMGLRRDTLARDQLELDRETSRGTVELRQAQTMKALADAGKAQKDGRPKAGTIADEMADAYSTVDGKVDQQASFEMRAKIAKMQVPVTLNGKTSMVNFAEYEQYDPEGARAYAQSEIKPLLLINKAREIAEGKSLPLAGVSKTDGGLRGASVHDQGASFLDGLIGRDGVMTDNGFALMKNIPESEHEIVQAYLDRLAKQRSATGN